MRRLWKHTFGLSLGLYATTLSAGEMLLPSSTPRPAIIASSAPSTPIVSAPAIVSRPAIAPSVPVRPVVQPVFTGASLDRPGTINTPAVPRPMVDLAVRPVSHGEPAMQLPPSLVASQTFDIHQKMPTGPTKSGAATTTTTTASSPSADPPKLGTEPPKLGTEPPKFGEPETLSAPRQMTEPVPVPSITTVDPGASYIIGPELGGTCDDGGCCQHPLGAWGRSLGCTQERFYGSAEALLWKLSDQTYPALLTAQNPIPFNTQGVPILAPGSLSGPQVLFGGKQSGETMPGGRFTIGYWFGPCHKFGVEGTLLFLAQQNSMFSAGNDGCPILARPYTNAANCIASSELVSDSAINPFTGELVNGLQGTASIETYSRLWGYEVNFRSNLVCIPWFSWDVLAGFRAMGLDEGLQIREDLQVLVTNPASEIRPGIGRVQGDQFLVIDRFQTENRFHGGQVGTKVEFRIHDHWIIGLNGKVAVGSTRQTVTNTGLTQYTPAGGPAQAAMNGGLLVQPTNPGFSQNKFSVIPELGVTFGYQFNEHWRAYVGYSALYWSNVVRPSDQVDLVVDTNNLPPRPSGTRPTRPANTFKTTDLWAHGVNVGFEFRY